MSQALQSPHPVCRGAKPLMEWPVSDLPAGLPFARLYKHWADESDGVVSLPVFFLSFRRQGTGLLHSGASAGVVLVLKFSPDIHPKRESPASICPRTPKHLKANAWYRSVPSCQVQKETLVSRVRKYMKVRTERTVTDQRVLYFRVRTDAPGTPEAVLRSVDLT